MFPLHGEALIFPPRGEAPCSHCAVRAHYYVGHAFLQNWPSDSTKIRSVLGGWLYAYELPSASLLPTTCRSDSPDDLLRRHHLKKVNRERTMSLKQIGDSKALAGHVREKLARKGLREMEEGQGRGGQGAHGGEVAGNEEGQGRGGEGAHGGEVAGIEEGQGEEMEAKRRKIEEQGAEVKGEDSQPVPVDAEGCVAVEGIETRQLEDSDHMSNMALERTREEDAYVVAVHRRTVSVLGGSCKRVWLSTL